MTDNNKTIPLISYLYEDPHVGSFTGKAYEAGVKEIYVQLMANPMGDGGRKVVDKGRLVATALFVPPVGSDLPFVHLRFDGCYDTSIEADDACRLMCENIRSRGLTVISGAVNYVTPHPRITLKKEGEAAGPESAF